MHAASKSLSHCLKYLQVMTAVSVSIISATGLCVVAELGLEVGAVRHTGIHSRHHGKILGGKKNKILSSTCTCISSPVTSTIRHFLQIKYVAIGSACNWELRYSVSWNITNDPAQPRFHFSGSIPVVAKMWHLKMWHLQDVTFTRCNIYKIWHLHFCQWLLNH